MRHFYHSMPYKEGSDFFDSAFLQGIDERFRIVKMRDCFCFIRRERIVHSDLSVTFRTIKLLEASSLRELISRRNEVKYWSCYLKQLAHFYSWYPLKSIRQACWNSNLTTPIY